MAQASTLSFAQFKVELGDGANPETFSAPCGLNSRGFTRTAATNETNVPDCDDPDAFSWLDRDTTSMSASLTGSGVVADEDFDRWEAWLGKSRNVRITLGARIWIGAFILTKLDVTGNRGTRTLFTASLESDGVVALQ